MTTTPTLCTATAALDQHIGGRVRARRKFLGVSQERLAQALGITFQQVQKYERGTNRIASSTLFLISGILEVPTDYFFQGLADLEPGAQPARLENDPALALATDGPGRRLAQAYAQLPERRRLHVVRIVEAMIDEEAVAA